MANLEDTELYNNLTGGLSNNPENNKKNMTNKLIRQCARWAVASEQDKSPLIALLHANYAAGYLWALKDIVSDVEIKQYTNIDILDFETKIVNIQDLATKKVSSACPEFASHLNMELLKYSGNV